MEEKIGKGEFDIQEGSMGDCKPLKGLQNLEKREEWVNLTIKRRKAHIMGLDTRY